jgi:hypothetical protein
MLKYYSVIGLMSCCLAAFGQAEVSPVLNSAPASLSGNPVSGMVSITEENSKAKNAGAAISGDTDMLLFTSREELSKYCAEKNISLTVVSFPGSKASTVQILTGNSSPVFRTEEERRNYCNDHHINLSIGKASAVQPSPSDDSNVKPK